MMGYKFTLLLSLMILKCIKTQEENLDDKSFISLYEEGVQYYLENNWDDCIYYIENSLNKYKNYYESVTSCRAECDFETKDFSNRKAFLHSENIENYHFYELILRRTLCLAKCKQNIMNVLPDNMEYDEYYKDLFKSRKPYEYLHYCYLKTDKMVLAASAALTYLVKNPEGAIIEKSLQSMLEKDGYDKNSIVDLEEKKFVDSYIKGYDAAEKEDWDGAILHIEESLRRFFTEEDQCRYFCEGDFDHGWYPDFITSIGNHFANTLFCKWNCSQGMLMVRSQYYEDLLSRHFEMLHRAHLKNKNLEEAARSAHSFLLFKIDDDIMNSLKTIENADEAKTQKFSARNDAREYHARKSYENKLFSFIKSDFIILDERDYEEVGFAIFQNSLEI